MQTDTYTSPFAGLSPIAEAGGPGDVEAPPDAGESPFEAVYFAESPFGEADSEADGEAAAAQDFLESLHDEEFEDAIEQLLDEGAAYLLADSAQWSEAPPEMDAREVLDEWMSPLISEWKRAVDSLAAGLENVDLTGMNEHEVEELIDSLDTPEMLGVEGFDNFLGKLWRKAKRFVKSKVKQAIKFVKNPVKGVIEVAKSGLKTIGKGVKALGKFVVGPILDKLKRIGLKLLKGVIAKLIRPLSRALPASVRPAVQILMTKLGIGQTADRESGGEETADGETGTATDLAEAFDAELTSLFFASEADEADTEEPEVSDTEADPVAQLDQARALLATQLATHEGNEPPIAEIEQFLPAILAIRPLLKLGLTVTGARGKLINLIASPLANLIKKWVGPEPARIIARAAVGVGFSALGLEAGPEQEQTVAGEALASAVEATVLQTLDELSDEALEDPLQVSAAVQRAFAEAAAAYLPDRILRADLPERETAGEGGFWVLMPRAMRPRYRFRKYTRVFATPIPRQIARAVPWSDGGTLETYLLDRGVDRWPVQAEIDLYETIPGTLPGHFTRDETLPADENPLGDEYQPLTPEAAGLLLREPAIGRRTAPVGRRRHRPVPGRRYFRVRTSKLPAKRSRRPRRLFTVRLDPTSKQLRIAIRLSERRARMVLARMQRSAPSGQRDLPAVLTALRQIFLPRLQYRVARRLVKSSLVPDPLTATQLAGSIAAATSTAIATFLAQKAGAFASAVGDPADGVTITVAFGGLGADPKQELTPEVAAHPGLQHA
ncbi:hypothetical protein [Rhodococcus tukisamuensis]|uniref:Uncharacterized protein n=1 Tax=Rhodococcus tukisamuensis TaxID=168276 RepID=A0A1G6RDB0_9NOCA|nr:hypothetical protein [Rhodococcus tukisamuensis]SDD02620.1 hypothetical protein SAMN05444580_102431 [Rhodococcus tukisamuensis]